MLSIILVLSLAAPPEPPKFTEAAQKELKKLEGKWKLVEVTVNGTTMKADTDDEEGVFEFKGTRIQVTINGKAFQEAEVVALDPTTRPMCIDWRPVDPKKADRAEEGIYKLDGDTLRIRTYKGKDKNRPVNFDPPKEGDKTELLTLQRVKE